MKVITFSRYFPKGHPKEGQPTYFIEKIWECVGLEMRYQDNSLLLKEENRFFSGQFWGAEKSHTIRAGNRWKVGDMASLRVWSDKPYRSKQIEFAQVEIKKVWPIERKNGVWSGPYSIISPLLLMEIAHNDGLEFKDFLNWFPEIFSGQIICWNENINY